MRSLALSLSLATVTSVAAQNAPGFELDGRPVSELALAVDLDDDDDDGVPDREQPAPPFDDVRRIRLRGRGVATLTAEGAVRLLSPSRLRLPGTVTLQATGTRGVIVARVGGATHRLAVRGLELRFEAPEGPLDPTRDALAPTQHVPNDRALPRGPLGRCDDPRCFRVVAPASSAGSTAWIESIDAAGQRRDRRPVLLTLDGARAVGPWMRLVVDEQDAAAPGTSGRLLVVGLRDTVQVRLGHAAQSLRVGRPGWERGPLAARRGRLRVRIVRHGGVPAVGGDDAAAVALGRTQVALANAIWLQCLVTFGAPERADVAVVDPPPDWLLSVSDGDGFLSTGGTIRLRAEGRPLALSVPAGLAPVETALRIARSLQALGLRAEVRVNPRWASGAGRSADVLVRRADGSPATLAPDGDAPLTTDRWQHLDIGHVDLGDGLRPFTNDSAAAGSLEERTLLHHVIDDDPSTIDVIVVNRFTGGGRQGEAFIEADRGAFPNVVLLDRRGIAQQRSAWTQSHEIGHVLLDLPFHPDELGPDRPWRLMDSDASAPLSTGPKRLSPRECARARHRSGVDATPTLLSPYPRERHSDVR